jgi:serine/threonine protein kinase
LQRNHARRAELCRPRWQAERLCYTCPRVSNDSAAADRPSLVGECIGGRYVLEVLLSADGACSMYRARDSAADEVVAVQILDEAVCDGFARARLERAVDTLTGLAHPNIAQILERGVVAERFYLVLEWLEGESLLTRLRRAPLALAAGVSIVRQLLAALASVHAAGLVHGRLDPSAVFLQRRKHTERVKLQSFGFRSRRVAALIEPARATSSTTSRDDSAQLTQLPQRAPELAGGQPPDARSDVFAVGQILSEIMAEQPARAQAIARNPLEPARATPPPAANDPALVAAVQGLIRRATATQRQERFSDAADMLCELIDAMPRELPVPVPAPETLPVSDAPPTDDAKLPVVAEVARDVPEPRALVEPASPPREPSQPRVPLLVSRLAELRRSPLSASLAAIGIGAVLLMAVLRSDLGRAWRSPTPAQPQLTAAAPATSDLPMNSHARTETEVHAATALPARDARASAQPAPAHLPASRPSVVPASNLQLPAARNPWLEPVPAELQGIPAYVESGEPGNEVMLRTLRVYKRSHPDDPRGHLLLGRLYFHRYWRADCLYEWGLALRGDPSVRGAPELLPALIQLVMQDEAAEAAEAAAQLIESAYGREALAAIDSALAPLKNTAAASRLHALRARIDSQEPG